MQNKPTPTNPPAMAPPKKPKPNSPRAAPTPSRWRSGNDERLAVQDAPRMLFSPTAWAKLLFLRDYGDTEVGGFGITAKDNLLFVEDVALVRQDCTGISVAFVDEAVADFFDRQVDQGRKIEQFARIWIHTHPGNSPQPSGTDEETFQRVFGRNDWAVMFILAQSGSPYARLQFHLGPGGSLLLPVAVDYEKPFLGSDHAAWEEEYLLNVRGAEWLPFDQKSPVPQPSQGFGEPFGAPELDPWLRLNIDEEEWNEFLAYQEAGYDF
jgi:hypothetical protein